VSQSAARTGDHTDDTPALGAETTWRQPVAQAVTRVAINLSLAVLATDDKARFINDLARLAPPLLLGGRELMP
jgi:hypothetical protein